MRQHDGVRLRMRQVEAAAQRVAELVVQGHADVAEHGAAKPGAVEAERAGLHVVGRLGQRGHALRQRADAFLRHQRHHRIAVPGVQPLGRMRDRVDAADHDMPSGRVSVRSGS